MAKRSTKWWLIGGAAASLVAGAVVYKQLSNDIDDPYYSGPKPEPKPDWYSISDEEWQSTIDRARADWGIPGPASAELKAVGPSMNRSGNTEGARLGVFQYPDPVYLDYDYLVVWNYQAALRSDAGSQAFEYQDEAVAFAKQLADSNFTDTV